MHNSDHKGSEVFLKVLLPALVAVVTVACSSTRLHNHAASDKGSNCSVVEGELPSEEAAVLASLQRSIESSPLYTILDATGVASCQFMLTAGAVKLEYKFRDGALLQVKRNESIEYIEQKARFVHSPKEDVIALLKRTEAAVFGEQGCGINWRRSKTQPAEEDALFVETIFLGDICNCQAHIVRDTGMRVVEVILRSAC